MLAAIVTTGYRLHTWPLYVQRFPCIGITMMQSFHATQPSVNLRAAR